MQIKRYKKLKNGMYELELESGTFILHEELILKYELLLKKQITDAEKQKLEQENLKYEAYEVAVRELGKRLRSRKELEEILIKKGFMNKDVQEVLEMLTSAGYLNEACYVDAYIHDKILLSKDGPLKIEEELRKKGISDAVILSRQPLFSEELERERVEKIVSKLVKSNRDSRMKFIQKAKYQLISRLGYHTGVVLSVLENIDIDDSNSYQKEYEKCYQKLSKKYSGSELEWRIKQKLYQKGYKKD